MGIGRMFLRFAGMLDVSGFDEDSGIKEKSKILLVSMNSFPY